MNTADLLLAAVGQSGGQLKFDDFTPLPCGDPNCATIGYLLRFGGQVHSVSEFLDFEQLQGFLKDKVHYTLEDLARCGCETEPLGALLKTPRTQVEHGLPHHGEAVHGRMDLGPGPHRPLLHPRHPARREAGFVLPLLLGICGRCGCAVAADVRRL